MAALVGVLAVRLLEEAAEAVAVAHVVAAVDLGPAADLDVAAGLLGAVLVDLAHGLGDLVDAGGLLAGLAAGGHDGETRHHRLAGAALHPAVVRAGLDPLQELRVRAQVVGAADVARAAHRLARRELRHALARHLVRVAGREGGSGGVAVAEVAGGARVVKGAVHDGNGVGCMR